MSQHQGCNGDLEPGDVRLQSLALPPVMETALDVMRCYFSAFAHPPSQGWLGAMEWSAAAIGVRSGPQMAFALLRLVQAMRASRRSAFRFSNPACPGCRGIVTETEARLLSLIDDMRHGRTSSAHANAMLLCEGGEAAAVMNEARAVGEFMDVIEARSLSVVH